MDELLYYRRSGRMGAMGLPLMLALGVGTGVLLGIPYGYAVHYCPLIYITFLITGAFGGAIGIAVNIAGRMGKVRNMPMLMLAALIGGLAGYYVAWVGYVHSVSTQSVWAWSPNELYEYVQTINERGIWSIKRSKPTGLILSAVWLVEAGVIVTCAILIPRSQIGSTPFNEQTDTWVDNETTYGPFALQGETRDFTERLERGDSAAIANLTRVPDGTPIFYQCVVHSGGEGDAFTLLSLDSVTRTKGKGGKEETTNRSVFRHMFISATLHQALIAKAAQAIPTPEATLPSTAASSQCSSTDRAPS